MMQSAAYWPSVSLKSGLPLIVPTLLAIPFWRRKFVMKPVGSGPFGFSFFGGAFLLGHGWKPYPVRGSLLGPKMHNRAYISANAERFPGSQVQPIKLYCCLAGQGEHAAVR